MSDFEKLIEHLGRLSTEQSNPMTVDIDTLSAQQIVRIINDEDKKVAGIVEQALPSIARAAELFAETLSRGGRVIYIGAGTSGRLGVLDAAECPPTFGTDPSQIMGIISGGYSTLVLSMEGVEDRQDAAVLDLQQNRLGSQDFVIGLAASSRTPYTLAGLAYAKEIGCRTAFIICNKSERLEITPDVLIELPVGPEVITGSTRMKSGTAQKMALNMISTTAMVLLGKTLGNLMVDLQVRSEKLAARSRKILMDLFDISLPDANDLLAQAGGSVKTAIVMKQYGCAKEVAERKLSDAGGFVRRVSR
ncbi:MAG: N-acetylmuramic acid 6-phosphate etherase [candidate division Zixibacteria bacterium]|jgi:N-acetylmuramic acid 6-phosphate etherase|nr:N-acetylmuramic acid 6-phosphate etherase [candidate division Zixibacteria bacterium]